MEVTLVNSLVLAGVIQGLIFGCIILFSKKHKSKSAFYLACLILSISLAIFQFTLEEADIISHDFLFNYVYIPWSVLFAPFLFFYVTTFLDPRKEISTKEKLLYVPFIVTFLISLTYKLLVEFGPTYPLFRERLFNLPYWGNYYGDLLTVLFMVFIILILFKKISRYEKRHEIYNKNQIRIKLNWLKATLLLLLLLTAFSGFMVFKYDNDNESTYFFLYIGIAALIYWLGYVGLYKIGILEEREKIRKYAAQQRTYTITEKQKNEHIANFENLMTKEKLFLDSTITLERVASQLDISKGHLSRVINAEMDTSFTDYINALRVEEAKSYLQNPDFSNYTLIAIGLEAGFNSKSTFNSVFKKITGTTPSQFKQASQN